MIDTTNCTLLSLAPDCQAKLSLAVRPARLSVSLAVKPARLTLGLAGSYTDCLHKHKPLCLHKYRQCYVFYHVLIQGREASPYNYSPKE